MPYMPSKPVCGETIDDVLAKEEQYVVACKNALGQYGSEMDTIKRELRDAEARVQNLRLYLASMPPNESREEREQQRSRRNMRLARAEEPDEVEAEPEPAQEAARG